MPRTSKDNPIGRKIRERRIQIGLSQEELGERLGVSYQQVQKYEKGVSQLTIERLQEMASSLSIPTDHFLKDLPKGGAIPELPLRDRLSIEEKRLLKQYRSISNPGARLALLRLVQIVARLAEKRSPA